MQTELTVAEKDALTERIARWAVSLKIGRLVAFMLEVNRPVAPLSGNLCIAVGPVFEGLAPFSINATGLFLQDDKAVCRLRDRILELEEESGKGGAGPGEGKKNVQQPTRNVQ